MEKSKRVVEGEQPVVHQNESGNVTNDSPKDKNPVAKRELAKASEVLGKRTSSKSSSAARSKEGASTSSKKEDQELKKATSSASEEMNPGEIELMEGSDPEGYVDTKKKKNRNLNPSSDDNWKEWEEDTSTPSKVQGNADQMEEASKTDKDFQTLQLKVEKAEKKVAKLKKKFKKARKKEAMSSKMKALKDKLIKANAKLKRRMKKLKKASE